DFNTINQTEHRKYLIHQIGRWQELYSFLKQGMLSEFEPVLGGLSQDSLVGSLLCVIATSLSISLES
ncbi:hypothetical protein BpHYR1_006923, partial [Brachionus plicatilis]